MRKGQIALEFMSMVILGIVFSLMVMVIILIVMQDTKEEQLQAQIKYFGFQIQRELILASEVHEGYVREIFLTEYIGKEDYEINNTATILLITVDSQTYPFLIPKTNGTLVKGENIIKNIDGEILIE